MNAGRWRGGLRVGETVPATRDGAGASYVACVNADEKWNLGLGRHAVAIRHFDNGEPRARDTDRAPVLRARCRLLVPKRGQPPPRTALLDQTVRNAIGIPFNADRSYTVDLAPIRRTRGQALSELLGNRILRRRYLFMRVCSADPGDMEKKMARVPADALELLGTNSGGRLVITHPICGEGEAYTESQISVQAYGLTDEISERRKKHREAGGLYARYPKAADLLGVDPDLASIYLDQQARSDLQVRSLEVVLVRRDDRDAFEQRIRSFGLAVVAASVAVVGVFPIDKTALNGLKVMAAALILATLISIVNLRASAVGGPSQ